MIYLDNAATTKPEKEVIDAIMPYLTDDWYNPSSLYSKAKAVRSEVDKARNNIARFIGAKPDELYFTSGATESNNWVIRGFIDYCLSYQIKPVVITSTIEHKSITSCVAGMYSVHPFLFDSYKVNVDKNGFVDLNHLDLILSSIKKEYSNNYLVLVSIQYANSEIGTIQHINDIAHFVHQYKGIFHTDATQALCHIPIHVGFEGIDLLSASAQKCGGLKGTGILYKNKNCHCIKPLIYGSQENGERGGTENVVGIIAMSKAVDCCQNIKTNIGATIKDRNYFVYQLVTKFDCKVNGIIGDYLYGFFDNRLPNNINVTFPQNITGEALIYMLDSAGIMISSGSACNSNTNKPSRVLQAIGLSNEEIERTVRITLPDDITIGEINTVVNEIDKVIKVLTEN